MHCPDAMDGFKTVQPPFGGCVFKNKTYAKDERFYDGCEQQCQCVGYGDMVCLSRCPPTASAAPGQNCYTLPDISDTCCNITVCDDPVLDPEENVPKEEVTEGRIVNHGQKLPTEMPNAKPIPGTEFKGVELGKFTEFHHGIAGTVYALNQSSLFVKDFQYDGAGPDAFFWAGTDSDKPSEDGVILPYPFEGKFYSYQDQSAPVLGRFYPSQDVVLHLPGGTQVNDLKWLSVWCRAFSANFGQVLFENEEDVCSFEGKTYQIGEHFYKDCDEFCICFENDAGNKELMCNPIKCPSSFGLDVINPMCLEWEEHADFVPSAPMCCPPPPVCLSDGTCHYQGHDFRNYDSIPANITGCEKRCYCEDGEVLCRDACHEISPQPPSYLQCSADVAIKVPTEDRPCCMVWDCPAMEALPDHLNEVSIEPLNATAVKIQLKLPKDLDGRSGYFKVNFVSGLGGHQDPNNWPSQDIEPKNGLFEENTSIVLSGLLPNKQFFLKTTILVRESDGYKSIDTDIASGHTPQIAVTDPKLPKIKRIDIELTVKDVKSTSALANWRFFSTEEKQYIDGVQIRFSQLQNGIPTSGVPRTTPFIHRDTNFFLIEDLSPDTEYQIDVYLIPVPRAKVEMVSDSVVTFSTLKPVKGKLPLTLCFCTIKHCFVFSDPYLFDVHLNVEEVGNRFVGLSWGGVPEPHQQFVNIYRILYVEENSIEQPSSVFKIAKINSFKATRIGYLKPGTK